MRTVSGGWRRNRRESTSGQFDDVSDQEEYAHAVCRLIRATAHHHKYKSGKTGRAALDREVKSVTKSATQLVTFRHSSSYAATQVAATGKLFIQTLPNFKAAKFPVAYQAEHSRIA